MLSRLVVIVLVAFGCFAVACGSDQVLRPDPGMLTEAARPQPTRSSASNATAEQLQLVSSAFSDNGPIPQKYTCDGEEKSPPLVIIGAPEAVETFALIVTDIDGPGNNFVHWTIWNIDSSVRAIPEGAVPQGGVEGQTGLGGSGYVPPCPRGGVHRYAFELYALDTIFELDPSARKTELLNELEGHILAQVKLTGTYGSDTSAIPTVP
jgi:hypothetical protein